MSSDDCSDGNPCTIDACGASIAGNICTHTVDPCLAGQYCELPGGCTNYPACSTTQDCANAWAGDVCKTNIVCNAATSLCAFDPLDADHDGHPPLSCGGDDCDDSEAARFPGAPDLCDGKNNSCFGGDQENSPACTLAYGASEFAGGSVAVDATSVYWASDSIHGVGTGAVMKVPIGGGDPVTLAGGQDPGYGIAVDATNVYWINRNNLDATGTVMKVPITGGAPTQLAYSPDSPSFITIDATHVYWTDTVKSAGGQVTSKVMMVPISGGNATTLVSGPGYFGLIAVDATSAYLSSQDGTITKMPIGGGNPVTLASGQDKAMGFAMDATDLYWTTYDQYAGTVIRVPLAGGAPITLASGQGYASEIAVGGVNVYWGVWGGSGDAGTWAVMKAPVSGGAPIEIVGGQDNVLGLAVDAANVYWSTSFSVEYRPR
jgi:hypothetical protein